MRLFLMAFAVAAAFLAPLAVYAIDDPDNGPLVEQATAYQNVLEDGDLLLVVLYRVDYNVIPAETIATTYVGRFLRDSTELRTAEIFPFNNRGYGLGVFSFYWTATQRSDDSVEFNNPNSENYIIRFQGLPSAFPGSIPTVNFSNITYQTGADVLRQDIIDLAEQLERDTDWSNNNVDLIAEAGGEIRLTASGSEYFANVVPNLAQMGTGLFASNVTNPAFQERNFDFSDANRLERTLDGTPIGDGFDALADLFNVPSIYAKGGVAIFLLIGIASATTGLLAARGVSNAGLFGALSVGVVLPILARIGLVTIETAAIAAFLAFGAIIFLVVLKRSG